MNQFSLGSLVTSRFWPQMTGKIMSTASADGDLVLVAWENGSVARVNVHVLKPVEEWIEVKKSWIISQPSVVTLFKKPDNIRSKSPGLYDVSSCECGQLVGGSYRIAAERHCENLPTRYLASRFANGLLAAEATPNHVQLFIGMFDPEKDKEAIENILAELADHPRVIPAEEISQEEWDESLRLIGQADLSITGDPISLYNLTIVVFGSKHVSGIYGYHFYHEVYTVTSEPPLGIGDPVFDPMECMGYWGFDSPESALAHGITVVQEMGGSSNLTTAYYQWWGATKVKEDKVEATSKQ